MEKSLILIVAMTIILIVSVLSLITVHYLLITNPDPRVNAKELLCMTPILKLENAFLLVRIHSQQSNVCPLAYKLFIP